MIDDDTNIVCVEFDDLSTYQQQEPKIGLYEKNSRAKCWFCWWVW